MPSAVEVRSQRPFGHLLRSPAPVGRRGQALHVFIAVREPRLDPSPHRCRGRFVAACTRTTSADRCFNEHDDGPLEHPDRGIRGRMAAFRSIVASRSSATAEGAQGQGSRITEPRPSLPGLLPRETLPRPRSLQTPLVAGIAERPVWSGRGRTAKPPALRTLARRAQREGGAAPDLREETGRSPARGAFRREAVRERQRRSAGVSLSSERCSAFFTARRPREGRSPGAFAARPFDQGERERSVID